MTLWSVKSIGTTEPDGTPAPEVPDGFLTPNGEINDPTIPNPAPEFPAPPDGTPNISGKPREALAAYLIVVSAETKTQSSHSRS